MKQFILGLITVLSVNVILGQQQEKLDYCNCQDQIDQVSPFLNGKFERKCDGILVEKGAFINGEKNGEWITYSRKGKLIRKLNFNKGVLNGKVEVFYLNGKPKVNGQFENGSKIGRWTYFTKKGKILSEGNYHANKPTDVWVINDKKGKKPVVQYDYSTNKYITKGVTASHKDGGIVQNENTEEWFILRYPNLKYSSKSEPLGGYAFANYMFVELVEIPVDYWDTYLYQKYKVEYHITNESELKFKSELFTGSLPKDNLELTLLITTNPKPKIKTIDYSDLQLKLLNNKINEALSLMPPWIYNGESDVEVYIHYVINENLHR